MEKYIVASPMICFCLVFGCLILSFVILVLVLVNKGRKSSWKGKIVDKLHNVGTDNDGRDVDYYTIVIDTEEGKTLKIGLSYAEFKAYKVGDVMEKPAGKLKPFLVQGKTKASQ